MHELRAALNESREEIAPVRDEITYSMLSNLDGRSLEILLGKFNQSWQTNEIRTERKEAEAGFSPKLNKPFNRNNIRPIFLTSCIRKLKERIVLRSLEHFLEVTERLPNTMYGFRRHLSSQEVLIQLQR